MAANASEPTSSPKSTPVDTGLRCPRCDYNLTGLTRARCPECGETFDWDEVRRAAQNLPTIAFERARGWRKVPAFFVTWATVLFAPWIFARQIVGRVSTVHALVFAGACFSSALLFFALAQDAEFVLTWLSTAAVYIVLQAIWLSLLDLRHWRQFGRSLRFWLLAGCYTSAVVLTEFWLGPPPVWANDLWDLVTTGSVPWNELYEFSLLSVLVWTQMTLWLAGLGCIYARRTARRPSSVLLVALSVAVCLSLLILYSLVIEQIGGCIHKFL